MRAIDHREPAGELGGTKESYNPVKNFRAVYGALLSILPANARGFVIGYAVALSALAVLDAAALGLLALVVSPLASNGVATIPLIGRVEGVGLILLIGVVCVLVLLKGALSVLLLWVVTRRFAVLELELGSRLFDSYIEAPWVERLKHNSSDLVRMVDSSVSWAISNVLLPGAGLLGEAVTFLTVVVVLAIVQPLVALIALAYLGLVGAAQLVWITKRSRLAGEVNVRFSVMTSQLVTEIVGALKEITLRNKTAEVAAVVRASRSRTTRARANVQFLGQVPRYVLEAAVIGGFVLVGVAGYLTDDMGGALAAVAIFALAGFRMAPSLVRVQAVASQVAANLPHTQIVIDEVRRTAKFVAERRARSSKPLPDSPEVLAFEDVAFSYSEEAPPAVSQVDISIPFRSTIALVGASGAGKSTMVDLILGLIEPTHGRVLIDGEDLTTLTDAWRSRIAYVPQDVTLFDRTVGENVALTWDGSFDRERVRTALEKAQLLDLIESRQGGIDGRVGERGLALSGGQRQRIGIARALYGEPLVLVMDEATSALDTATEAAVTDAIKALRGSMTIITVAHRLSTVMHSDQIFFMSGGRVEAQGTFEELVERVPEFARQAGLAGLTPGAQG